MPKGVDHDERRAELAEAVWRVVETDGLEGLTMRRIAHEALQLIGACLEGRRLTGAPPREGRRHSAERETSHCDTG